jgi:hypothetical protein
MRWRAANLQITVGMEAMFMKIKPANTETEIEVVAIMVRDLGFEEGATREEIFERATTAYGLDLIPAELGPQLRLQYTKQPMNEWLPLAMEPIAQSDGRLLGFALARYEDGPALDRYYVYPGALWFPDFRFVFVRRREVHLAIDLTAPWKPL